MQLNSRMFSRKTAKINSQSFGL